MSATAVSREDVLDAARALAGKVVRTPVVTCEALDAEAGAELFLKAENLQYIGAFKARGAQYAVSRLDAAARARGVLTYSSGNHGQAVALAAQREGLRAHVVMPEDAPAIKRDAVEALGAAVSFAGTTSPERRAAALQIAEETGATIIEPFDHPHIVAGQGTATLELLEDAGPLDALLVPVGGGGLIAGACLACQGTQTRVYSVEPVGCDAMAQSLAAGQLVTVNPGPTLADGLKPSRIGELNFAIARQSLAGALTVTDGELRAALIGLLMRAKLLVEPSGAAALAAAIRGHLPGNPRRIGVILSGGNIGPAALAALLSGG